MKRLPASAACTLLVGAATAAGQGLGGAPRRPTPQPVATVVIDGRAFLSVAHRWRDPSRLTACWEDLPQDPGAVADRALVQAAVEQTWVAASGIRIAFSPSTCVPGAPGIHIQVADTFERTAGLGDQLDRIDHGLTVNFTFRRWKPDCPVERDRARCLRVLAVHEFGHALGFSHEQNRTDTADTCRVQPSGPFGDVQLNRYDPDSIMNYCNTANTGLLSKGDKAGIQFLYPKVG